MRVDHHYGLEDLPIVRQINVRRLVLPVLFLTMVSCAFSALLVGYACHWRVPIYAWVMTVAPWWAIWLVIALGALLDRRTLRIDEAGIQSGTAIRFDKIGWNDIKGVASHTDLDPRTGVKVRNGIDLTVQAQNGARRTVTIPLVYAINDRNLRVIIMECARKYGSLPKDPEGYVDSIARVTDGLIGGDFRKVGE